jgi:hypothetical protein
MWAKERVSISGDMRTASFSISLYTLRTCSVTTCHPSSSSAGKEIMLSTPITPSPVSYHCPFSPPQCYTCASVSLEAAAHTASTCLTARRPCPASSDSGVSARRTNSCTRQPTNGGGEMEEEDKYVRRGIGWRGGGEA